MSGSDEPEVSPSVYRGTAWLAVVGLLMMLILIRGPLSRAFDIMLLWVVFGGGAALACVSAPAAAHLHAWSLSLANGPVDPDVGRAARLVLRTEARALLVMGVLAALIEIISFAPFLADPVAQRMVLQLCGIALLYGVGGAGLMVWPAMASIERREGVTDTPAPGFRLSDVPRYVWIVLAVWVLSACVAGWLGTRHFIELASTPPPVPVAPPTSPAAPEP